MLDEGKRGNINLDEGEIPPRKHLLRCCLGLVIVDEETITVRFVHYALEEYLKNDSHRTTSFPNGYMLAAQIRLMYLNFHKPAADCNDEYDMTGGLKTICSQSLGLLCGQISLA